MPAAVYFQPWELECPCCKACRMDPAFMELLNELRRLYDRPIHLNSAFRCQKHNAELKDSSTKSQHLFGRAVDIQLAGPAELYALLRLAIGLGFRGIGIGRTFLHLDTRPASDTAVVWTYPLMKRAKVS